MNTTIILSETVALLELANELAGKINASGPLPGCVVPKKPSRRKDKRRGRPGNARDVLSKKDFSDIRNTPKYIPDSKLVKKYKVSQSTINRIRRGVLVG